MLETYAAYELGMNIFILIVWAIVSLGLLLALRRLADHRALTKARILVGYIVISAITLLFLVGKDYISPDYFANLVTETLGIAFTVLIIDWVNTYLTNKNEALYRDLALRRCRMPIFAYCQIWLSLWEPNKNQRSKRIAQSGSIEEFFQSDELLQAVQRFNFMNRIGEKTYAQFYHERIERTEEDFQSVLVKYASKLSLEDLRDLEYFGGGAYIFNVFRVMNFLRQVKFTDEDDSGRVSNERGPVYLNKFSDLQIAHIRRHFTRLSTFIESYNRAANPEERWSMQGLAELTTLTGPGSENRDW